MISYFLLKTLYFFLLGLPALYIYSKYRTRRQDAQLALIWRCKSPKIWRNADPLLGLDLVYHSLKALKNHLILHTNAERFTILKTGTMRLQALSMTNIMTIEPENLKTILATDFHKFELPKQRKELLTPLLGESIFVTDGEAWRHSREILRPSFTKGRVSATERFESHVRSFINRMPPDASSTVNLQPLFFDFSMDVATEFLFGTGTRCLRGDGESEEDVVEGAVTISDFVNAMSYYKNTIEAVGDEAPSSTIGLFLNAFLPNFKLSRCIKTIHSYVDAIIDKALVEHEDYDPNNANDYIFLHEVISQTTDTEKIRAELLSSLLAGRDTTASLLSNVWYELARRPQVWARLQTEIASLDGANPTHEQLKEMKYINAILKESLRVCPVVPENGRTAKEDTFLPLGGGEDEKSPVFVKKGWLVSWTLWAMHKRKDIYGEDAEEFRPERWLDVGEEKGLRVSWDYLPFNGGPRICIGQQFALAEASYMTVRLAQEFSDIVSRDPEPWREKVGLTATGLGGCKVALTPRSF